MYVYRKETEDKGIYNPSKASSILRLWDLDPKRGVAGKSYMGAKS